MLEGLEVSEVSYKAVITEDSNIRIESDFFKKEYIIIEKIINSIKHESLDNLCFKVTDGTHYTPNYFESGVPFLSALNVKENYLNIADNFKYISIEEHQKLFKRCDPKAGDILLRKVGVGARMACVIPDDMFEFSIFVSVALIKGTTINKYYLSTFINSKFGQTQLFRLNKGSSQPDLHLEEIRKLKIPILSKNFQDKVEKIVLEAKRNLANSKTLYTEAENILLEELGLNNWQPTIKNNNTKTLKESFLSSGRIDAEYYQPKYDEILRVLKQFNHDTLGNLVSIQKSIEPGSDFYQNEGIPFIRVANLSKNGISEADVFLSNDEFGDFAVMPKKNTILLSKDGSVGIAYKVEEDMKAITSGAILHLTVVSKKVLPDYLTLVLNSVVVKLQAERDAGGSIIQHWKPDEIKQVIIPVIDNKIQKTIADKIQQSFALQSKSQQLLEAAKKAVEMAIEQNEEMAMDYLKVIETNTEYATTKSTPSYAHFSELQ